jgi:hypothetical protein
MESPRALVEPSQHGGGVEGRSPPLCCSSEWRSPRGDRARPKNFDRVHAHAGRRQHGYGEVDPEAFDQVELEGIPGDARQVGAMLVAEDDEGNQRSVRVHEVRADGVVLDLNHPLAGQALNFSVRIVAIE